MAFVPNLAGLTGLLASDDSLQLVDEAARSIADRAKANMPVGATAHERDSVVSSGTEVVDDVAVSYAGSESSTTHLVEFGSVNNPPYRPFRRAIEDLGLQFEDPRG